MGFALLLEPLHPFSVDLDSGVTGLGEGLLLKYLAHVVEQFRDREHHRGRFEVVQPVQEELGVDVTLICGLRQPVDSSGLVILKFLAREIQLAQHILAPLISQLCRFGEIGHCLAASLRTT